jgi:hypothetical protein
MQTTPMPKGKGRKPSTIEQAPKKFCGKSNKTGYARNRPEFALFPAWNVTDFY